MLFDSITALVQTTTEAFITGTYWIGANGEIQEDRVREAQVIDRFNPMRRQWLYRLAGDSHSIEDVVNQLAISDTNDSEKAFVALHRLLDPAAAPGLRKLLSHHRLSVRLNVIRLLGEIRDVASLAALLALLENPEPSVQGAVVIALWSIGDPQAIAPLEAKLARTKDERLRNTIMKGLNILKQ